MIMEENRGHFKLCILRIYLCLAITTCFMHCDARRLNHLLRVASDTKTANMKSSNGMNILKRFGIIMPVLDSSPSNAKPYLNSPFSMPPYESLPPIPLPEDSPPFCVNPPLIPQPPSTTIPTPGIGGYTPPPPSTEFSNPTPPSPSLSPPIPSPSPSPPSIVVPSPPEYIPSPPSIVVPSPPEYTPSPSQPVQSPPFYEPSPPITGISPPMYVPSPTEPFLSPPFYEPNPSPPFYEPSPPLIVPFPPEYTPGPPIYLPPPHGLAPSMALWCVAKPSVPKPIVQEAMNYACASGSDCNKIEPNGSCFQPDTIMAHASFAFNSYWQRTKVAGGTCQFGGAAMLVTVDPSHDSCLYTYY